MEMASAFTLNVRLDNIAIITIDVPGEKMNTSRRNLPRRYAPLLSKSVKTKSCVAWCLSPRNQTTSLLAQTST